MREDIVADVPLVAANAQADVISELMELDPELARKIVQEVAGLEYYHNPRHATPKTFSLGLEAEDHSVLMRILESLIKFIGRMIEDVTTGTTAISLNLHKIQTRAEEISTASRAARRTNKGNKIKIETRIQNLCINFKPIKDPQSLLMYLKSVDATIRKYFKYQDEELLKVIPTVTQLNATNPLHLDTLVNVLKNVSPSAFAMGAGFAHQGSRYAGPHLLGNQQLMVITKYPQGDAVERLAGEEFILQPSDMEPKPLPEFLEFDLFPPTTEQSILRQIIATTHDLGHRIGVMARMRRNRRVTDLSNYLERIRNEIAAGQLTSEQLQTAGAFIQLLEAFDNWLVNPYLNLLALSCRNMSAVLNVCEANN